MIKKLDFSISRENYYNKTVKLGSNKTSKDIEVRIFEIYVKDKDGNTIVTLQGYVGGVIPAGETREIESNVDMDLSNATDLEYKLVK